MLQDGMKVIAIVRVSEYNKGPCLGPPRPLVRLLIRTQHPGRRCSRGFLLFISSLAADWIFEYNRHNLVFRALEQEVCIMRLPVYIRAPSFYYTYLTERSLIHRPLAFLVTKISCAISSRSHTAAGEFSLLLHHAVPESISFSILSWQ